MITRSIDVGGVNLEYRVSGNGQPVIVALHGTSSDHNSWGSILDGLGTVYAPDLRGHGQSARSPSYKFVDFAEDVVRLIEIVADDPVILIGHSAGASIGLYVAANRPDLISAVVAEEPPLYVLEWFDDSIWPEVFSAAQKLAGVPFEQIVWTLQQQGLDEKRARSRALGLSLVDPRVFDPLLDRSVFDQYDTDAVLEAVRSPTLLLHDAEAPGSALRLTTVAKATSKLSDVRVIHIPEAGHNIHGSQPETFLREVAGWIQALT